MPNEGSDSLRKIIHSIDESNRNQTNDMKEFFTRLQTELALKIESLDRRMELLEGAVGNKTKARTERKTATAKATTAGAKGAAAPQRVPVTWTQYVAYKFETNEEYYTQMMAEERYKEVADAVKGLDKIKDESAKRKKQGTAVANWIKVNEEDNMEAIKKEHREFKATATKAPPPVQQKAEADSEGEGAADAADADAEATE